MSLRDRILGNPTDVQNLRTTQAQLFDAHDTAAADGFTPGTTSYQNVDNLNNKVNAIAARVPRWRGGDR